MTIPSLSVALAPDFSPGDDGAIPSSFGLTRLLVAPGVDAAVVSMPDTVPADVARGHDALLLMDQQVTETTLDGADELRLVARYGVGTNSVDLEACTRHGVIVSVTPEGVTRPVASGALALVLSTTHRIPEKSRLLLDGRWHERGNVVGIGLTGRTILIVGLGRTGRELARLLAPWGARLVGYDPYVPVEDAAALGVELLELDDAIASADIVCLLANLTPETHHLLSRERIGRLKPGAIVVNVSRGPLIDQPALVEALLDGHVAGAGLDVFEDEPIALDDPLLKLATTHNVVVTPHSLVWTDECFLGNGSSATDAILSIQAGILPKNIANPAVLEHPRVAGLRRAG